MLSRITILIVMILALSLMAGSYFRNKPSAVQKDQPSSPTSQAESHQKEPDLKAGEAKIFYNKDNLYLTHSWPGENNFSNEETEVLIFNESDSKVEVKSFDLNYTVEGKTYPHKSGTWEKFPDTSSWDRMEYLNISSQYYKGEPLILEKGQKGKLHWHINFGPQPLDGKQTVKVKLTIIKNDQTINIGEEFTRNSGTVFSNDEH